MMQSTGLFRWFKDANWPLQYLTIAIYGGLMFLPFIGHVHLFDWDEANFAEIAREMRVTGEYFKVQVGFQPFYEKPPLFAWVQNVSFSIWGMNEFGARFPNAIVGITCLLFLFKLGKQIKDSTLGLIWVLCYSGSILPFFFFKTGLIDPLFNLLIFASLVYFIRVLNSANKRGFQFVIVGLLNGLAILTKGPVALLILALTIFCYWLRYRRNEKLISFGEIFLIGLGIFLMSLIWFGPETIARGPIFIQEFVIYMIGLLSKDIASHAQPFYYHFIVILIGCFPISVFALKNLFKPQSTNFEFSHWMVCLFWVVLILFSIVKTKIINYSSLTYYPLSYLAAQYIYQNISKANFKKISFLYLGMGILWSLTFALFPILIQMKSFFDWVIKDSFSIVAFQDFELPPNTVWIGLFWLIGIIFTFILFIRHKLKLAIFYNTLFLGISLNASLLLIVPHLEKSLQGPAIGYFQQLKGEDVFIGTIGFKSYAKYFYSESLSTNVGIPDRELLTANPGKPTYLIVRHNKIELMKQYPDFKLISSNKGFYLFLRQ